MSERSRLDQVMAWVTLVDLPAWAALVVIGASIGVSWLAAFYLGGGTNVAPHWFYLPIFLAGLRFGWFGALVAGGISMYVAGPLLPADATTGAPQALSDWVSRGIFFILIGQFVTALFVGVRRISAREGRLETEVELGSAELQAREARFSALVENSSDLVMIVESDGQIAFRSPSVTRALGWHTSSQANFVSALEDSDQARWHTIVEFLLEQPGADTIVEWSVRHGDGSSRVLQSVITNLTDEPSVAGLVLNSRDITAQKELEDQLRHQAFHDPLTGLANRALFAEQLEQAVRRSGRLGAGLALLFIDLDSFKAVNDLHGHVLGDDLLAQVADRLKHSMREADAVARLSGDEFAVLFEGVALDSEPDTAADRLLEAFSEPFRIGSADVFVTASIGIALADTGDESAEDLLRNADLAMYAAKTKNRGSYEIFSPDMHSMILERMQTASDLRRALDRGEFQIYYQPIVDGAGTIEGAEALIRWNHPDRGLVLPGDFIGAAESSGIIVPIGEWVLRNACHEFATSTHAANANGLGLSVNLSTRQLSDAKLFDIVQGALTDSGLEAQRLTLEITESAIMENVANTILVLSKLRGIGVKIAIDDFGTGYSSLSLLNEIPLDTLKIDRVFVTNVATHSEPARLIRAILALAGDLGLRTVAEGVEHRDQHELLHDLGCDASQGYYFARPQPATQLIETLAHATHDLPKAAASTGSRTGRSRAPTLRWP